MTPEEILDAALREQMRARSIVAELGPCPVVLSNAHVTLGAFTVDKYDGSFEIRISRHLDDADQVRETARHELAHQAAWQRYRHFGHGPLWQTLASYLGCEPVRCARFDVREEAVVRFVIACTHCAWSTTRLRRSRLVRTPWRYACSACGSKLRVRAL